MSRLPFLLFIPENAPQKYGEFWQLWQDEKFFEAHETLEDLWRETQDERKLFFNGLIHAVVALYQHRRGNAIGAARQNVRMQEKLTSFAPEFYGVQIDKLIGSVETEIAPSVACLSEADRAQLESLRAEIKEKLRRN